MSLAEAWAAVLARVAAAAARAGRDPAEIRIVAVSKTHPIARIEEARAAGILDFGENYIQEWAEKADALADSAPPIRWHLIGRLQRRKAKEVARRAASVVLFHALDDLRVAEELDKRLSEACEAPGAGAATLPVLVEVHATGEETKGGVTPATLGDFLVVLARFPHLAPRGLMAMGPLASYENPEASREAFRLASRLAQDHRALLADPATGRVEISMGMTSDFEVAVEEGATIIRIGTALFGAHRT